MSRRSYDTDVLTIRRVFALNPNGSYIPALQTLTSDGQGGSYWAVPATLGGQPAINSVTADGVSITASAPFNTLYLSSSTGIGYSANAVTGVVTTFGKSFGSFAVQGGNTLNAYSNSVVSPTVTVVGKSGILISANPDTQTLTFQGIPTAISTGIYGYSQICVTSNTDIPAGSTFMTALSVSTVLNMVGVRDIILSTNVTTNTVFMSLSTFTSQGYLDISGVAYGTFSSAMSTVSTLFYDTPRAVSTTGSLLTQMSNISTGIHAQIIADQANVMNNYTTRGLFEYTTGQQATSNSVMNAQINLLAQDMISTFHFRSSIGLAGTGALFTGFVNAATAFECSTVSFRLDSMSTLLRMNPITQVTYCPSLWFGLGNSPTELHAISTCIRVGTGFLSNVTFVRPWQAVNTAYSNLYYDTIQLTIPSDQISTNIRSTFTFYHTISSFKNGATGIQSLNYLNSIDPVNGVNLTLLGTLPIGLQYS